MLIRGELTPAVARVNFEPAAARDSCEPAADWGEFEAADLRGGAGGLVCGVAHSSAVAIAPASLRDAASARWQRRRRPNTTASSAAEFTVLAAGGLVAPRRAAVELTASTLGCGFRGGREGSRTWLWGRVGLGARRWVERGHVA